MKFESQIYTPRYSIRSLKEGDSTEVYLSWFEDETVKKFIVAGSERQTLDKLKSYIRVKGEAENCLLLGIFEKDSGKHIGNIKYEPIDFEKKVAFMGILIGDKNHRGVGTGPEVIKATSRFLKDMFSIEKIKLGVLKNNNSAIKSYYKIGFQAEVGESRENSLIMTLII